MRKVAINREIAKREKFSRQGTPACRRLFTVGTTQAGHRPALHGTSEKAAGAGTQRTQRLHPVHSRALRPGAADRFRGWLVAGTEGLVLCRGCVVICTERNGDCNLSLGIFRYLNVTGHYPAGIFRRRNGDARSPAIYIPTPASNRSFPSGYIPKLEWGCSFPAGGLLVPRWGMTIPKPKPAGEPKVVSDSSQ